MIVTDEKGNQEIVIDLWGDFALFTRTETKVERSTYDVPTPSAIRGILEAILCKPVEFRYQVTSIGVIKQINNITFMRNEVKEKADVKKNLESIDCDNLRTQRHSYLLKDVYYRVHAIVIPTDEYKRKNPNAEKKFYGEFEKRLKRGKCFYQPYFGSKEYMCFFDEPDESKQPIQESRDLGIMLYDIFDQHRHFPIVTSNKKSEKNLDSYAPSYFHAYMINGIVKIPEYDSMEVFRQKGE